MHNRSGKAENRSGFRWGAGAKPLLVAGKAPQKKVFFLGVKQEKKLFELRFCLEAKTKRPQSASQ